MLTSTSISYYVHVEVSASDLFNGKYRTLFLQSNVLKASIISILSLWYVNCDNFMCHCDENCKKMYGIYSMFCFILSFLAKMERCRLATILVCRDIPIGCSLPRDLRISNNTCLPICPYWMPPITWLWISNNTCLPMHPYWIQCPTWCSD